MTGEAATLEHVVTDADTALAVGSGDVPVLGTPRLLALAEAATVSAVAPMLGDGQTSVGTRATLEHLRPSPVGARIRIRASVVHVDGRLVRLDVGAEQEEGDGWVLVGRAEITRVIVDRDRFLGRIGL